MLLSLDYLLSQSWITFDVVSFIKGFGFATVEGLTFGAIYALIAVGYTVVYGVLGLINFAHAGVFVTGCYALVFTLSALGFSSFPSKKPIFIVLIYVLIAVFVSILAAAAVAFLVERVAYKPLRKRNAPNLAFLITAIGASLTISNLFFLRSPNPEPALSIFTPVPLFKFFGATVTSFNVVTILAAVILMFLVDWFIRRTRFGRGIRAVAQDPNTASLVGVNPERVIALTFVLGGVIAGAASLFYVLKVPSGVVYNADIVLGLKAFAAAVLGGIGSIRGALLGGLLLGLFSNWGALLLGNSQWGDVSVFVLLLLVLLFRPSGILGRSGLSAKSRM